MKPIQCRQCGYNKFTQDDKALFRCRECGCVNTVTWPPNWVEVFCNDCRRLIGAYDTTCPQLVMGFYCTCSSNVTWIEPAVRR